jgi:hypothetical protein
VCRCEIANFAECQTAKLLKRSKGLLFSTNADYLQSIFKIIWHLWNSRILSGSNNVHWGDPDVDGRIILRWIFRKWEGVVGTECSWLRIGTGGGHLSIR